MFLNLDAKAGRHVLQPYTAKSARSYLGRRFHNKNSQRLLIYYEAEHISFTQVYPFLFCSNTLKDRYDLQIRCRPISALKSSSDPAYEDVEHVLVQVWFETTEADTQRIFARLKKAHPNATISFMDSFAHNDARTSKYFADDIKFYFKKSIFKDNSNFLKPYYGGTNLTDYYGKLYGLNEAAIDWQTPKDIIPKLHLSPNFFTSPKYLDDFARHTSPPETDRPLDIQTRFGTQGTNWYSTMRKDALKKIRAIPNVSVSSNANLSWPKYMEEMRHAKLCFSPFGYGELCWRDIEAIATGAVLIKPDMSHLETSPNIYQPYITYVPIKWDFSDLQETIQSVLTDQNLRHEITQNAYRIIHEYVSNEIFADHIGFLFN